MENMDNLELNEMREQISLLREKLRQQEIVSEAIVISAVKKGVKTLNRRGVSMALFGIVAVPFCCAVFAQAGMSAGFVVGTAIMLIISVLVTMYAHFGLGFINVARNNLMRVGVQTLRLRKVYKSWYYYTIPMLLIWGYFLYREIATLTDSREELIGLSMAALIGGLIGGVIGLWIHFRTIHEADEVLQHIREMQSEE